MFAAIDPRAADEIFKLPVRNGQGDACRGRGGNVADLRREGGAEGWDEHTRPRVCLPLLTLGPRMKYSSCLYETGKETLAEAEVAMLRTYVEKAELKDGMSILDLGYVCRY